ncbi:flagellar FlbD family protein [Periweissella fabaria]|uniref:Flagellar protein FlbD n=1 Tax=Periweissella fabaria TaxID=546157 RepID=A0ABM8Z6T4_9LACO|nr:flagellar FlbD family protein [Periweissella fabaria]MCM0597018.1 flagellar FlbD family protein [Periweissella fabaria]CAH0416973.1 hypothetical protein WFA24289_01290 [Periweissella fabaria]
MIQLTSLVGKQFYVNFNLIEQMNETPDTVLTLTDGKTFVVQETAGQVVQLIIEFQQQVHQKLQG